MVVRSLAILLAVLAVGGCASPGRPWTEHKITLASEQIIELSSYETRLYTCPEKLVLACSTIGGGGRVGYVRCGCALSDTVRDHF